MPSGQRITRLVIPALLVVGARALCGEALDVAALERRALAGSPRLAAAEARWTAARAAAEGAGALDDPSLQFWLRNALPGLVSDKTAKFEVEAIQPLPFPGKRQARRDLAAAEAAAAGAALVEARADLVAELRRTFAELSAADREERLLAEAHELFELLEATVTTRLSAGQQSTLDVLQVQLALSRHDQMIDTVFARFQSARARLAELAGTRADALPLAVGELPVPDFPVAEGAFPIAVEEAPGVRRAALELAAAERRERLAELDLRPDFGAGGGTEWAEGAGAALTLRFGVELPLFRAARVRPRIAAATAQVSAARADLEAERLAVDAESVRIGAERDRLTTTLQRLTESLLPRASAALDAARVAFLNGQGTLPRLLELSQQWFDTRIGIAHAEAERFAVWADWRRLAEGNPASTAPEEVR